MYVKAKISTISDMELIAQTPRSNHRAVRHQYDPSIHHGSPWGLTTATPLDSTTRWTIGYPSAAAVDIPTDGPPCGTQGALTQKIYGKPASFSSVNSTYGHGGGTVLSRQLEARSTGSNSSAQHPSKRIRVDDIPVSDRVSVSGSGGGGSAFSTPHFRISTLVRSAGAPSPTSRPPPPTQSDQAEREKEDEEEDGFDNCGPGDFLLDPEAMLVPSPPQVGPYVMQRHCNISNSDRFAVTTTTHLHKTPIQVTVGQDEPPPLNLGPVLSSTSFALGQANVNSLANDLAPVPRLTDTYALMASQQLCTVRSKRDNSLSDDDDFDDDNEGEESLAPDMSLLDGIEKEIQDLADF
ncbi:MAG: hypothetical protein J3R72DRAFT_417355 [Linnemannia gamsii]|nr:MAG: hypothetical protein J3R72DRAFT_417355 [Linnemannia gamsii]